MANNGKTYNLNISKILKVIYYLSVCLVIIGIIIGLITFFDTWGWKGLYLAIGTLYPFCVFQTGYIMWYKVGKANCNIGNLLIGMFSAILTFCVINIVSNIAGMKSSNVSINFKDISFEVIFTVALLIVTLFLIRKLFLRQHPNR